MVDLQFSGSVLRDEVVLRWAVHPYLGLLLGGRGDDQRLVRGREKDIEAEASGLWRRVETAVWEESGCSWAWS